MKTRIVFALSTAGLLAGLIAAYLFGAQPKPQPPAFAPATNPYDVGIYANGIVESFQNEGANINIYPDVSGRIVSVNAAEGAVVPAGTPLLAIDDSVQRAAVDQAKSQSEAALSVLNALKAQPRKENLDIVVAQREASAAAVKLAQDQYQKLRHFSDISPQSISKDTLDTSADTLQMAQANLDVASKQLVLARAGAWNFDIESQQKQYTAALQAQQAASALLEKYTLRAPVDGVVLVVSASVGSYVSPQGSYDSYTHGQQPLIVMSSKQDELGVRCYIDEILVSRVPPADRIKAEMSLRGSNTKIPLQFVRVQPYVSPKISLSDQRTERVDLRVLPLIFKFSKPEGVNLYPGQLVDVYIGTR